MRRKRNCGDADATRVSSVSGARVVTSRSRDEDDARVIRRPSKTRRRRFWCDDDVEVNDGDRDAVVMSARRRAVRWDCSQTTVSFRGIKKASIRLSIHPVFPLAYVYCMSIN